MLKLFKLVKSVWSAFLAFFLGLFDDYKAERYYMRGPGPAWHKKHSSSS